MEKFDLNNLKIGYFIVYRTEDKFYHKLIQKQQLKDKYTEDKAQYIHVELSLGGPHSVSATMPRIKISDIQEDKKGNYIKVVKPKMHDYDVKRKNVAIEGLKRINLPYGVLGVFWFKIKKVFKNNFLSCLGDFCSELCGYCLYEYYVKFRGFELESVLPKYYTELYPADFLDEKYFEVVWEGYIN